jgi:Na+-transporting methylmalonyl-CoA/oxaloacetate decarboxylase gamma subunit/phage shock protein PspC (stress-responsive transcriptional regulator)
VRGLQYDNRDVFMCLFALLIMTGLFFFFSVLIFFFKWVNPMGTGIKRRTNKEMKEEEQLFIQRARDYARDNQEQSSNTLQTVLKDGAQLQKQNSASKMIRSNSSDGGMTRANSNPNMTRNNSNGTMPRNDSAGNLSRADSFGSPDSDSNRKMFINPANNATLEREESSRTAGSDHQHIALNATVQESSQQLLNLTENDNGVADGPEVNTRKCCTCNTEGAFVRPFLSRIFLVIYFIIDFLAASTICNGQENAFAGDFTTTETLDNVTAILGGLGNTFQTATAQSINVIFVLVTAVFLVGYVIQFAVQFALLFPRDTNNRINPCTRIALLDILGAGFLAANPGGICGGMGGTGLPAAAALAAA